jgi:hypothetical protein
MPETRLIATLLRLIDYSRCHERALVAGLSEAERAETGTAEDWSAKDLIAHLTSWHGVAVGLITSAINGETPIRSGATIDEINARFFAGNAAKSWDEVMAEADQAVARISGLLPQLDDAHLTDPARYPWRRGQALAPALARPIYWHPMLHLGERYLRRQDGAAATVIVDDVLAAARVFAPWPELRGNTLYTAADLYALAGQTAEALDALHQALPLVPFLVDWSKRDPSLASLRNEAGYQALYQ